jgi:hypothetical protein
MRNGSPRRGGWTVEYRRGGAGRRLAGHRATSPDRARPSSSTCRVPARPGGGPTGCGYCFGSPGRFRARDRYRGAAEMPVEVNRRIGYLLSRLGASARELFAAALAHKERRFGTCCALLRVEMRPPVMRPCSPGPPHPRRVGYAHPTLVLARTEVLFVPRRVARRGTKLTWPDSPRCYDRCAMRAEARGTNHRLVDDHVALAR